MRRRLEGCGRTNAARVLTLICLFVAPAAAPQQPTPASPPNDSKSATDSSKLLGKDAPAFVVKTLDGKQVALADYRGKAVVVNFWATWCEACRQEMPWLAELREKYAVQGFEVLGIVTDRAAPEKIASAVRSYGVKYPILFCNHATAQEYGGLPELPVSFFVDRDGKIIAEMAGADSKEGIEIKIKQVLPESAAVARTPNSPLAFVVHGGVDDAKSGELSPADEQAVRAGVTRALLAGYAVLKRDGSSVDAVEAALRTFEDDATFDAGRGSVVNTEGVAELDAAIMDGQTLKAGSVAAVHHIPHPISLARLVMDRSSHVMLVGEGAEKFATSQGVQTVPNSYFITPARRKKYEDWLRSRGRAGDTQQHGTTGAIALDSNGNLAAGTTTGGTSWKLPGRVGDSPIIGAGTYANNALGCAVSSSGTGEYFIRNTAASDICRRASYLHQTIDQAADYVIHTELKEQGGDGGVIVLDRTGHFVRVFNTNAFWVGYIDATGKPVVELFQ